MLGQSAPVTSKQKDIHPNLDVLVHKHLKQRYLKPIAKHTQEVWQQIQSILEHSTTSPNCS